MRKFSDFGIVSEPANKSISGRQVSIQKLFGVQFQVLDYIIMDSKFNKPSNPECLKVQINWNGEVCYFYTGSNRLLNMIKENKDKIVLPFTTTLINEEGKGYTFT